MVTLESNSTADGSVPPGNTEVKLLVVNLLLMGPVILPAVLLLETRPQISLALVYLLPILLSPMLYLAIRLYRQGTGLVPLGLGITGVALIVGGAFFDIFATMYQSPDLQDEANPAIRLFLDVGQHSLAFVFGFQFLIQTIWNGFVCLLWLAFLRHREILVAAAGSHHSIPRFLKAVTGGARLTWRQYLFPVKYADLPAAYFLIWPLAFLIFFASVARWYLGFEWFGLVEFPGAVFVVICALAGIPGYLTWIYRRTRVPRAAGPDSVPLSYRHSSWRWIVDLIIVLVIFYVLSFGPVCWTTRWINPSSEEVIIVTGITYEPILRIWSSGPPSAAAVVRGYANLGKFFGPPVYVFAVYGSGEQPARHFLWVRPDHVSPENG